MMAVSREATFRRKEGEETPRVRKRHSFSLASPCDALAASASRALPPHPPNSSIYQFSLFMFTNDGWYNDCILCTLGGGGGLSLPSCLTFIRQSSKRRPRLPPRPSFSTAA